MIKTTVMMMIIDNNNNNNNNNNTIADRVIVASLLRARGRRGIAEICLRGYRSAATGGVCGRARTEIKRPSCFSRSDDVLSSVNNNDNNTHAGRTIASHLGDVGGLSVPPIVHLSFGRRNGVKVERLRLGRSDARGIFLLFTPLSCYLPNGNAAFSLRFRPNRSARTVTTTFPGGPGSVGFFRSFLMITIVLTFATTVARFRAVRSKKWRTNARQCEARASNTNRRGT